MVNRGVRLEEIDGKKLISGMDMIDGRRMRVMTGWY